jgi:hypothetical protein
VETILMNWRLLGNALIVAACVLWGILALVSVASVAALVGLMVAEALSIAGVVLLRFKVTPPPAVRTFWKWLFIVWILPLVLSLLAVLASLLLLAGYALPEVMAMVGVGRFVAEVAIMWWRVTWLSVALTALGYGLLCHLVLREGARGKGPRWWWLVAIGVLLLCVHYVCFMVGSMGAEDFFHGFLDALAR